MTQGDRLGKTMDEEQRALQSLPREKSVFLVLKIAMFVLVAAIILVPIALTNRDVDARSAFDNRVLQAYPDLDDPQPITVQLSAFMADRIGLREQLITESQILNSEVFGVLTHPLYEFGKDKQVFFNFSEYQSDLEYLEYLEDYTDFLLRAQEYCESRGSTFLFVITPEKGRIYPERLPGSVHVTRYVTDDLISMLERKGISYLDLADVLINNKTDYKVFNDQYNAGHWNDTGAFFGVQEILKYLQVKYPRLKSMDFTDYKTEDTVFTRLQLSDFPIEEAVTSYSLKDSARAAIELEDYSEEVIRNFQYRAFRYFENPAQSNAPSALFFSGSYFNGFDSFSRNYFSRLVNVHNYNNAMALPYYYNLFEPDIVIIDCADYTFYPQYFSDEAMRLAAFSPPYVGVESLPVTTLDATAAFGEPVFEGRDGFSLMTEDGPSIVGTLAISQPDALGHLELNYGSATKVSNYLLTWKGPAISSAYALVDEKVYDFVLVNDGSKCLLEVGFLTDDLKNCTNLQIIGVAETGDRQYQVADIVLRSAWGE